MTFSNNVVELYFEVDNIVDFSKKLESFSDIIYLHPMMEHSWGQRAVRFYDLDYHIIEVAENISMIAKRFINSGLTVEQTAKHRGFDIKYTKLVLEQ